MKAIKNYQIALQVWVILPPACKFNGRCYKEGEQMDRDCVKRKCKVDRKKNMVMMDVIHAGTLSLSLSEKWIDDVFLNIMYVF